MGLPDFILPLIRFRDLLAHAAKGEAAGPAWNSRVARGTGRYVESCLGGD